MKALLITTFLVLSCHSYYPGPHGPHHYAPDSMMHGWRFGKKRGLRGNINGDIAKGKQLYAKHCQQCHGISGKGDGPAAKELDPKPADLTRNNFHHRHHFFFIISEGSEQGMPAWKSIISEDEIFDLISYIKTI